MVEGIADRVRELEEYLTAWKSLATENCSPQRIAVLERQVLAEVSQVRATAHYRESVGEFLKALGRASVDDRLIQRLYEEVFQRMGV
jgi:hypothetical protein